MSQSADNARRRLFIRPGAIGDCIVTLPAMRYLHAQYTEVWAPRPVVPLIDFADSVQAIASTGIDLVGVGDGAPSAKLQAHLKTFDSIVSWYGSNRPEFQEAVRRITPCWRFLNALPPATSQAHAVDFFASQVGAPPGMQPSIAVGSVIQRDAVVIHPFSGGSRKNWPLASYRKLAASIRAEASMSVEWSAGPEEELEDATRYSNLKDLAKWLAGARLYIGNDSGITHLAAAAGCPTIAIFGPTDPRVWAPRWENVRVIQSVNLDDLSVNLVLDEAMRMLSTKSA